MPEVFFSWISILFWIAVSFKEIAFFDFIVQALTYLIIVEFG